MPNIYKAMKGLECCTNFTNMVPHCKECPYADETGVCAHIDELHYDTAELLKAQKTVIDELLKVGYPRDYDDATIWTANYLNMITEVIRKAVRLRNASEVSGHE